MRLAKVSRRFCIWLLGVSAVVCQPLWSVPTLTINGMVRMTPQTMTIPQTPCRSLSGAVIGGCTDTAFISNVLATPTSTFLSPGTFNGVAPKAQTFTTGFNTAVTNQASLKGWKMVDGGTLDLTINATFFPRAGNNSGAFAQFLAGMTVRANVTNYDATKQPGLKKGVTAPTAGQLVWTQALYINFQPNNPATTPAAPMNTLDDYTFSTGGTGKPVPVPPKGTPGPFNMDPKPIPGPDPKSDYATVPANTPATPQLSYADPIYPFQGPVMFGINSFADLPFGPYQTPVSFRAVDLLTAINTTTKTLTLFSDGIDYGFDLKTPEPSFMVLLSVALGALLFLRRRQRGGSITG